MLERPDSCIIENPKANILLANIETAKKLLPFFLAPKSLTEAAKEMEIEANSYYYWLKKFLSLGLLIVAYEKKRTGSKIKYYITPAKTLFLKADVGLVSIKDYFIQATTEYNKAIVEGLVESLDSLEKDVGIIITNNGRGALKTGIALLDKDSVPSLIRQELLKPSGPAAYSSWSHFRLTYQDAKELQLKLANLVKEYEDKSSPKQQGHYVQLSIVPEV